MTNKSRACVVVLLVITCGGSHAVGQTGWSISGNYGYNIYARDDYQSLNGKLTTDGKAGGDLLGPGNVVSFGNPTNPWMAQVGDQKCDASAFIIGSVGSFHLDANANAKSTRTQDFLPLNQVFAQSNAGATLNFKDQLTFRSKKPGTRLVKANWTITGDSETIAEASGVVSPSGGFDPNHNVLYDSVVSQAEASFDLSGTGVPNAPAFTLANGIPSSPSTWAYSYRINGGITEPTIDKLEYDNPSSIPVTFLATPGQMLSVSWTFSVYAYSRVNNFDLNIGTGTAFGASVFAHTVNWGGITSVVDANTGEPDLDWSVESASGLDYANPVVEPEPASIVLAAIGSIAALAVARRKSTSTVVSVD